jgi:Rrf2 family protein
MLLPQTAEYALRATIHIAAAESVAPGVLVRVGDVAEALGLPRNYLSKTLHQLARGGVLASTRGPAGGFRLAMPADELSLERVVGVFTEPRPRRCLLGTGRCGENADCPVHTRWKPVGTLVSAYFANTTIADVVHVPVAAGSEGARGDIPSPPPFQPRRRARQESTP